MPKYAYCPNCGIEIESYQEYCQNCGTNLKDPFPDSNNRNVNFDSDIEKKVDNTIRSQNLNGLFSKSRKHYVVKEKYWDFGSGPIYDAKGVQLGKMKRQLFSFRQKIDFYEMNETLVGSIHRKILAFEPTYKLFTVNNQLVGEIKKKIFTFLHPKFYFHDSSGIILFMAVGNFMGFDFKIYRGSEENPSEIIAEIHKADRWKDFFLEGMWDFKDTFGVKIYDSEVDRFKILGFVIVIDNVLHDD